MQGIDAILRALRNIVPPGYVFDKKKFEIDSVGSTPVHKQLTELEDAAKYILAEVRIKFDNEAVIDDDAYFHINEVDNDPPEKRIAEEWYWTASFTIIDGFTNGKLNKELTSKPYITVCAGTSPTGVSKVRGSVRYYYK